ncbi:hypothetical protein BDW60DRAFT_139898 [Aspergillus nidulans var. acristatus]
MHARDRLRLSILPQNAEEPVQYEEFARERIARDDEEWKRVQETCDRVFDQHLQNHEALRIAKATLEVENADLKQQILDLNRKLEEDPVTAELRQKLEVVTAERNEMALRLAREISRATSVVSATSTPKSQKIADPEQLSDDYLHPEPRKGSRVPSHVSPRMCRQQEPIPDCKRSLRPPESCFCRPQPQKKSRARI